MLTLRTASLMPTARNVANIATNRGIPISDANMVVQLQLHMDKEGIVSSEYTKWCLSPSNERTWTNAKSHFVKALLRAEKTTTN